MAGSDGGQKSKHSGRRAKSARSTLSDHSFDQDHYIKLVAKRLRKSRFLPEQDASVQAMQTRHVNNYQHKIPFRKEFIEQLAHDFREIDRKLRVDRRNTHEEKEKEKERLYREIDRKLQAERRNELEQKDKRDARLARQTEIIHAKKERELELYNHRSTVEKLLQDHLKKSTPQEQLRRIAKLEEKYNQLKDRYDELIERVNRNENTCKEANYKHDEDISAVKQRFEEYRSEINEYKKTIGKMLGELELTLQNLNEKLDFLNEKQREHGVSMEDLSNQHNTFNKFSQHLQQIINDKRSDLNKLEIFTRRLDNIQEMLDQIRAGFQPLDRIPELERQVKNIQNLYIQMKEDAELNNRVNEMEQNLHLHTSQLQNLIEKFNALDQSSQTLNNQLHEFQKINQYFSNIEQRLQVLENDLQLETSKIKDTDAKAIDAINQINTLHEHLNHIRSALSDLENFMRDFRSQPLQPIQDNPQVSQLIQKQKQLIERLESLQKELEVLQELSENLRKSMAGFNQLNLDEHLQKMKEQIINEFSSTLQSLNDQIHDGQLQINELKAQLNQEANQKQEPLPPSSPPPPAVPPLKPIKLKRMPFIESLPPIDLFDNIWI